MYDDVFNISSASIPQHYTSTSLQPASVYVAHLVDFNPFMSIRCDLDDPDLGLDCLQSDCPRIVPQQT